MSEETPRKGWGRGFVWGCLTPLILIGLLVVGAIGYGGYYLMFGYKSDAAFQTVMAAVQHNGMARAVLGDNIVLTGIPTYSFAYDTTGHHASYAFAVQGSKAPGHIAAFVVISGNQNLIKSLVLTGPNGQSYNLIGNAAPAAATNAAQLLPARQIRQPA